MPTQVRTSISLDARLTQSQVMQVVNRYIGGEGGYLGNFSYRTHAEFYPEYCELDYDPNQYQGTTRDRFITILSKAPPAHQARILRGVVERFPVGEGPGSRTAELRERILAWADQAETASPIPTPDLRTTSGVVERALADAETLIRTTGAPSSVDRIHTALHGYLEALSRASGIRVAADAQLAGIWKALREQHPKLQPTGPRAGDITRVMRAAASILDALSPLRNNASVAHPNEALLEPAEAMLVVNTVRTLLHYINERAGPAA